MNTGTEATSRFIGIVISLILPIAQLVAQTHLDSLLPTRGLCLRAPAADGHDRFVNFIEKELSTLPLNTLILRIDYNYQYTSRPELANVDALSRPQVKELLEVCRKHGIRIIPQINLLGHQSWHSTASNLLKVYPEFDETPWVDLPAEGEYKWPNDDGLYCKSYCPLHPQVHKVVFDLVDEIVDVFEADAFHAGLDEVFYLAEDKCPRCRGYDPANLFADEIRRIHGHLARQNVELWMWGDRLLDGRATGIGMWEASMNNTHQAINLIPKDVVINDWHYERADPTAVIFAAHGFRVASCPWRLPDVALEHLDQNLRLRQNSTTAMKERYMGIIQTIWTSPENFMDIYEGIEENRDPNGDQVDCFRSLFAAINSLAND